MNKTEWKQHSIPSNAWHFIKMAYKHYRIVFVFIILQIITGAILPLMGIYLPRLAIELAIENRGVAHVMLTLGLFAGALILLECISGISGMGRFPFQNAMRDLYHRIFFLKALECDYNIMETSEGQSWYQRARDAFNRGDWSVNHRMLDSTKSLISGVISFAFLTWILTMLSPLIVSMLIVLSIAGFIIDGFPRRYEEKFRDENGVIGRKLWYVEHSMSDISAAKDMRIYNLPALVSSLKQGLYQHMHKLNTKIQNRHYVASTLNSLLTVIRDGVAYAFCIWHVLEGNITVPEFTLFMGAIAAFSNWLGGIAENFNLLKQTNVQANEARAFFDYTNKMDPENPTPISKLGREISIEFRNVSFRYSSDSPNVLENLNFYIRAKEKAALVGINGAGKTTIVKLLCGFYKATEGEVLLNGRNINEFKRKDLYTLFSAVFQDICVLPYNVAQNVTFQLPEEQDTARIMASLEAAGIKDAVMSHSKGLHAPMTKILEDDGLVLSGGQQQKLTIARALYKNGPILILDEPTAALDPIAESEVYEKFNEVTENKTAIYISHRLASTRFCDKILMLKDGKIVENGSHDQLLAQGGEYATMFEIQSHYYQDNVQEVTA